MIDGARRVRCRESRNRREPDGDLPIAQSAALSCWKQAGFRRAGEFCSHLRAPTSSTLVGQARGLRGMEMSIVARALVPAAPPRVSALVARKRPDESGRNERECPRHVVMTSADTVP